MPFIKILNIIITGKLLILKRSKTHQDGMSFAKTCQTTHHSRLDFIPNPYVILSASVLYVSFFRWSTWPTSCNLSLSNSTRCFVRGNRNLCSSSPLCLMCEVRLGVRQTEKIIAVYQCSLLSCSFSVSFVSRSVFDF